MKASSVQNQKFLNGTINSQAVLPLQDTLTEIVRTHRDTVNALALPQWTSKPFIAENVDFALDSRKCPCIAAHARNSDQAKDVSLKMLKGATRQ